LRAIELFIYMKEKETTGFNIRLHNTVNDINDIFKIDKVGYEIVDRKVKKLSPLGFEPTFRRCLQKTSIFLAIVFGELFENLQLLS